MKEPIQYTIFVHICQLGLQTIFLYTTPMFHRLSKISSILILLSFAYPAEATIVPPPVLQAIVWIGCDDRQGTGTVISGEAGYVLTNAHVAIDIKTKIPAESCVIGFTNGIGDAPMYYYDAHIVRYVFNQNKTQDFD